MKSYMNLSLIKLAHSAALVALLTAAPLRAAPDTGLTLHDTGIGQRNTGVGATVGIRIQLGSSRVVKQQDRVKLGIAAGPVMVLPDPEAPNGVRRSQASFVGFDMRPGYSTSLNFAGQSIVTNYTRAGAAEKGEDDQGNDKQTTGDKIGWIAAVAGGVMVALIVGYVASCGPGEDNSCGSD